MQPITPTPRRAKNFTIESLIAHNKDTASTSALPNEQLKAGIGSTAASIPPLQLYLQMRDRLEWLQQPAPFFMRRPREQLGFPHWTVPRQDWFLNARLPAADPGLFFQPFRKPKRIRTAFSPSQLLRLEKAFDSNHYVVGQERKELAGRLGLTETQVKVWFQNRRTKYKRIKADEDDNVNDVAAEDIIDHPGDDEENESL